MKQQIEDNHDDQQNSSDKQRQQNTSLTLETDRQLLNEPYEYKNYGNTIPLKIDEDGNVIYLLGPHYYIFIFAWIASIVAICFIIYVLIDKANYILLVASTISALLYAYYYAKIGISSPGIASSTTEPGIQIKIMDKYCIPCRVLRQAGTRHCYYCDVCIYNYDHHCPWVGKCIGRDNICLFYIFLGSVSCMMALLILSTVTAHKLVV